MTKAQVAYFSMEMMLETDVPTYAGGLGVLAGDIMRSGADLGVSMVGVSIVYSGDTFNQTINPDGTQTYAKSDWQKLDQLTKLPNIIDLTLANTRVQVGCWRYDIVGLSGHVVPVYLLDTNLVDNPPWARDITKNLYSGGDSRVCQELVLGVGGIKMLRSLGIKDVGVYHLNEGHTAFATLELLAEAGFVDEKVRKLCVFTTHTPIPEGHDKLSYDHVYHFGGQYLPWHIRSLAGPDVLSMTHLALNLSHAHFAVSKKHAAVSSHILPDYTFASITNGVHHRNWVHNYFQDLYNQYLPGWLEDPSVLKHAVERLPDDALWQVHQECKRKLVAYVNRRLHSGLYEFDANTFTISLARRPVAYKRPLLLYHDLERFVRIGAGRLQIVQCGKSHPDDNVSQDIVRQIVQISQKFKEVIKIVYLENYSPKIARLLVSGSDIWLNTPHRPLEASGTSGMKAALNGVLNFSVLDGWWIESQEIDSQAGFSIGPIDDSVTPQNDDDLDADDLYLKLEHDIIPGFYHHHAEWVKRMKHAIVLGSYFNTHRVVHDHLLKAWK